MKGVDPKVVCHELNIDLGLQSKQQRRRLESKKIQSSMKGVVEGPKKWIHERGTTFVVGRQAGPCNGAKVIGNVHRFH